MNPRYIYMAIVLSLSYVLFFQWGQDQKAKEVDVEESRAEIIELRPEQPPADDSPELSGEASELADAGFAQDEELIEQLEPSHTDANDVDVVDSKAADSQDKVSEDE